MNPPAIAVAEMDAPLSEDEGDARGEGDAHGDSGDAGI